jgi:1-phosphatidylinositol phosphodiesterase
MLKRIFILFILLCLPVAAHAGKGAHVVIDNGTGGVLTYRVSDASGLSSDTELDNGKAGSINTGARSDIGYVESRRLAFSTRVTLTIRDAVGNEREIALSESDGRWSFWLASPTSTDRMIAVIGSVESGDQDTILLRTKAAFGLETWMHDLIQYRPAWKTRLVTDFAMLGTHDSTTYAAPTPIYNVKANWVVTQNQSIADQLSSGVRFLDYRLGWRNNQVEMFHSAEPVYLSFEDAMNQINTFLAAHGDEFVLLSVKIDQGDEKDINRWLAEPARAALLARLYRSATVPSYDAAKGKIVVLNRKVTSLGGISIDIPDNAKSHRDSTVAVQDAYEQKKLSTGEKVSLIRDFYLTCMRRYGLYVKECTGRYKLNFVSGTNLGTPRYYSEAYNPILLKDEFATDDWAGVFIIDSFNTIDMRAISRNIIAANF